MQVSLNSFCGIFDIIILFLLYYNPAVGSLAETWGNRKGYFLRASVFFFVFFLIFRFLFCAHFFVVAHIDNAFLNMCEVIVSTMFCISAKFCLPEIFSRCFAAPFFTNPNAPATIGIIDVFNFRILSTLIWRSLYFESFSNSLAEIFVSIGNTISLHAFSLWYFIVMSGLFACIFLSVWIEKSHKVVALSVFTTFCGLCSHQFLAFDAW